MPGVALLHVCEASQAACRTSSRVRDRLGVAPTPGAHALHFLPGTMEHSNQHIFEEIRARPERGVLAQLIDEHRRTEAAFEILLTAEGGDRRATFAFLARDLLVHAHAEQLIVYRRLAGSDELGAEIDHAIREHAEIEHRIAMIEAMFEDGRDWQAAVEGLRQLVMAHVLEEERDVIPRAHFVLDEQTIEALLDPYLREREIVRAQLTHTGAPDAEPA
jgi:hypothetical protein